MPRRTRLPGGRMPLVDHLRELRTRVLLAAAGVVIGAIAGWFIYPWVFDQLLRPLLQFSGAGHRLATVNFATVSASLDMQLKVAIVIGLLISSPWWLYQLWAFITPALTRQEKRYTIGYLAGAVPLFLAGGLVAWLLLPKAVGILVSFTPDGATNLIDAQSYLTFVMRMVIAFGIAFLLPVLVVALNAAGVVSARRWLKTWRWAILIIFIFAAMATPTPDAISMLVLAIPMCLLYFGAVGLAVLHDRRTGRWRPASTLDDGHPTDDDGRTATANATAKTDATAEPGAGNPGRAARGD